MSEVTLEELPEIMGKVFEVHADLIPINKGPGIAAEEKGN